MANVKPFRGLRYDTKRTGPLSGVTTPPYDIISPLEQEMYCKKHKNSIIHLELGKT